MRAPSVFLGNPAGTQVPRQVIEDVAELYTYAVRCGPQEPPGRHEIGTPQTELFAGLAAATDYFVWLGEQTEATGNAATK